MTFQILRLTENYVEGYREALNAVLAERKFHNQSEHPTLEQITTFVRNNIKNHVPQFIALSADVVVGWCEILPDRRSVFAHCGTLGMGVLSLFRSKGIGRALVRPTIDAARDFGLTRIALTVQETNSTAIALYQSFGFKDEGLHLNAVRIDGRYENLRSMALTFD